MTKTKKTGFRANSGRKKLDDKKKQVSLYIRESKINKLGGEDQLKEKIINYIDSIILNLKENATR